MAGTLSLGILVNLAVHVRQSEAGAVWFCGSPQNNCYYSDNIRRTFYDAELACKERGMHLVMNIGTPPHDEQNFITTNIDKRIEHSSGNVWINGFWIGYTWVQGHVSIPYLLSTDRRNGEYVDANGNSLAYNSKMWYLGASGYGPDRLADPQCPTVVYPFIATRTEWMWEDQVCTLKIQTVCQADATTCAANQVDPSFLASPNDDNLLSSLHCKCPSGKWLLKNGRYRCKEVIDPAVGPGIPIWDETLAAGESFPLWFCNSPDKQCYYSDNVIRTNTDAEFACKSKGMHLPLITSFAEQEYFTVKARPRLRFNPYDVWQRAYWMAYNKWNDKEKRYEDPNGNILPEPNRYYYKHIGGPDRNYLEDCTMLVYLDLPNEPQNWWWEDHICYLNMTVLCQAKASTCGASLFKESMLMSTDWTDSQRLNMMMGLNCDCEEGWNLVSGVPACGEILNVKTTTTTTTTTTRRTTTTTNTRKTLPPTTTTRRTRPPTTTTTTRRTRPPTTTTTTKTKRPTVTTTVTLMESTTAIQDCEHYKYFGVWCTTIGTFLLVFAATVLLVLSCCVTFTWLWKRNERGQQSVEPDYD